MTYEEIKNLLKRLSENKRLLRALQRQMDELRKQAMIIPALRYEKERVKGGENTPAQQRYIEHLERLEESFNAIFESVCQTEDIIAENLKSLTPTEQTIIVERYINGKSWKELQKEYHYTDNGLYTIHNRSLKKIAKKKIAK